MVRIAAHLHSKSLSGGTNPLASGRFDISAGRHDPLGKKVAFPFTSGPPSNRNAVITMCFPKSPNFKSEREKNKKKDYNISVKRSFVSLTSKIIIKHFLAIFVGISGQKRCQSAKHICVKNNWNIVAIDFQSLSWRISVCQH